MSHTTAIIPAEVITARGTSPNLNARIQVIRNGKTFLDGQTIMQRHDAEIGSFDLDLGHDTVITVTSPVTLTRQTRILGGTGTSLQALSGVGNNPALTLTADGSSAREIALIGEQSNFTNISLQGAERRAALLVLGDYVHLEKITVNDAILGVYFNDCVGGSIKDSVLSNSVIRRGYLYGGLAPNNSVGVYLRGGRGILIDNVTVDGFGQCIDVSDAGGVWANDHTISRNRVSSPGDSAIYIANVRNMRILNNPMITDYRDCGIKITGEKIWIEGNYILDLLGSSAISMFGRGVLEDGLWNGHDYFVRRNEMEGSMNIGVQVQTVDDGVITTGGFGSIRNYAIEDNVFRFTSAAPASRFAIYIQSGTAGTSGTNLTSPEAASENASICRNAAYGTYLRGLYMNAGGSLGRHLSAKIEENYFPSAAFFGLYLRSVRQSQIRYNTANDVDAANTYSTEGAMYLYDCDDNTVEGNSLRRASSYSLMENGTCANNVYRDNPMTGSLRSYYALSASSQIQTVGMVKETMAGNRTFRPGDVRQFILNPNGADRTITASAVSGETFTPGYEVIVTHAGSANTITFNPGAVVVLTAGQSKRVVYDGATWRVGS